MKKLMTMLAAVGMAFGLFADEPVDPALTGKIEFKSEALGNYTLGTGWGTYAGAEGTLKIIGTEGQADHVLEIATGSAALKRNFASDGTAWAIDADDGLFFDGVIDFKNQALDEIPTLDNGTKLALFVLNTAEMEEDVAQQNKGTNLYLVAGYGTGSNALYRLSKADDMFFASSHRVTIKAYNKVLKTGNRAGFMLYLDQGNAAEHEGYAAVATAMCVAKKGEAFDLSKPMADVAGQNYLGVASSEIEVGVSGFASNYQLFLSRDGNSDQKLTSVDFTGNAEIAWLNCTEEAPDFIPLDLVAMTYTDAAGLINDISGTGVTLDKVAKTIVAPVDTELTVTIDRKGFDIVKWAIGDDEATKVDGTSFTCTYASGKTLNVTAAMAAAFVGNEAFESLFGDEGAIAYVNENGGVLKLGQGVTLPIEEDAQLSFTGNGVTLNLNGMTITSDGTGDSGGGATIYNEGTLTIIDESQGQTGAVTSTAENPVAVQNGEGGTLTIRAGTYTGAIGDANEGDEATTITGGKFNGAVAAANEGISGGWFTEEPDVAKIAEGYMKSPLTGADPYKWEVVEAPKAFTVTVTDVTNTSVEIKTNDAPAWAVGGVYTVEADAKVVVTYTAATGYEITANGKTTIDELAQNVVIPAATVAEIKPTQIALSLSTIEAKVGDAPVTLIATVTPATALNKNVNWTSTAPAVATVAGGVVTFVNEGEATITATAEADGSVFASCTVKVTAASPWPTPDPAKPEAEAVAEAMEGAGFSTAAAAAIGTTAEYTAFQAYCDTQKIIPSEAGAAKDNAVLTYALGADACNEAITSEDITITAYDQAAGKLTVEIEGVTAGETINSAVLAKILTAKGGEEVTALDPDDVTVSGYAPADGEIEVTVAPKTGTPTAFFYQIELKK